MDPRTGVFITSYNYDRNAWLNHQERMLQEFYRLSDQKYRLVDNAEEADLILIVDIWEDIWGKSGIDPWLDQAANHALIKKYPAKSFSLSDIDAPVILHHGIYASGEKSLLSAGRVRTGSYSLFFDNLTNPFVEQFIFDAEARVEKEYLLSFVGRQCNSIRTKIFSLTFNRKDILVEDSSKFDFFSNLSEKRRERQKSYFEKLLRSKFSLCPAGEGASSLRLFESMQLGVAPVIVSDRWIAPRGVRWSDFSLQIKERQIRELEAIVASYESSYREMGLAARKAYEASFSPATYFNFVIDNCIDIRDTQRIPESFYQMINPVYIGYRKLKNRIRLRGRIRGLLKA